MNFLTVVKIYTVSKDGTLFVWSCSKNIDDITMKDKNNIDEDSGWKIACFKFLVRLHGEYNILV